MLILLLTVRLQVSDRESHDFINSIGGSQKFTDVQPAVRSTFQVYLRFRKTLVKDDCFGSLLTNFEMSNVLWASCVIKKWLESKAKPTKLCLSESQLQKRLTSRS